MVGVALTTIYVLLALGLGRAFPFFTLDMFSFEVPRGAQIAGPLLVERADGTTHRALAFDLWRCSGPPAALASVACDQSHHVDFRWQRIDHRHLTATAASANTAPALEEVQLIRHVYTAYPPPGQAPERCAIATCQASYAPGAGEFYGR